MAVAEDLMADAALFLDTAPRLGLSLAIGFLVGVERGWKQRSEREGERAAGLRTFALAGLLGGLTAMLAPLAGGGVSAALALAFCFAFILFQVRHSGNGSDNSATSSVAGLSVFALGAYAIIGDQMLAAAAAVTLTTILAFKQGLHSWLNRLTWAEIRSALLILAATFIVLPLLPEGPLDPWGLFDLRALWLVTIAVAAASFVGYVALRILGDSKGPIVSALAGGLVSSTAVTLDLARRTRTQEISAASAATGAGLATIVSLARVAILAAATSVDLIERLWPLLAAAALALAAGAAIQAAMAAAPPRTVRLEGVRSPLDILSVARFAGLLGLVSVTAHLVSRTLGHAGLDVFAAFAGLADVDAVTLAVGPLIADGLPASEAARAIGLAIAANQIFKIGAAALVGSGAFAWRFTIIIVAALAAGGAALILWPQG